MKYLVLVALAFGLVGCSGKKASDEVKQDDADVKLSDSTEFAEENVTTASGPDMLAESATEIAPVVSEPLVDTAPGSEQNYTVQKNETLMMVAFKIYGNYSKWREIYTKNGLSSQQVKEGTVLKYDAPSSEFVWNPAGNPYLIKMGDTLGVISQSTYSTTSHWKAIWDNNKPLIKDPNKIFVGFTIYTPFLENVAQN